MGRRGPPKMTIAQQNLANVKPHRRTAPAPDQLAAAPIAGKPPVPLGDQGRKMWSLVCRQQKNYVAHGSPPSITRDQAPMLATYCMAFDRWVAAARVIADREEAFGEGREHHAMFIEDGDDVKMHGAYRAEQDLMKTLVRMAGALGLSRNLPQVAVQVNNVANDPHPDSHLLASTRQAQGVILEAEAMGVDSNGKGKAMHEAR